VLARGEDVENEMRIAGLKNQSCERARVSERKTDIRENVKTYEKPRFLFLIIFDDEPMTGMCLTRFEHLSRHMTGETVLWERFASCRGSADERVSCILEKSE